MNCLRKPLLSSSIIFTAVNRDRITPRLIYDNKIFAPCCFQLMFTAWNTPPLNWQNCLLDTKNVPWNRFTLLKLIWSHAFTPRWLDDAKECIQSGWSKQRDCCSFAHEIPSADAGRLSKIIWRLALGFSTDLRLNATRRSINLSVYLLFDLEARRFKFLGENLLDAGAVENELSTLDS